MAPYTVISDTNVWICSSEGCKALVAIFTHIRAGDVHWYGLYFTFCTRNRAVMAANAVTVDVFMWIGSGEG